MKYRIIQKENAQYIGQWTKGQQTLIDVAENWLMLIRVELGVFEDNKGAIHLYEKFSFEKEGLKRFAGIRNSKSENEYLMAIINPSYIK